MRILKSSTCITLNLPNKFICSACLKVKTSEKKSKSRTYRSKSRQCEKPWDEIHLNSRYKGRRSRYHLLHNAIYETHKNKVQLQQQQIKESQHFDSKINLIYDNDIKITQQCLPTNPPSRIESATRKQETKEYSRVTVVIDLGCCEGQIVHTIIDERKEPKYHHLYDLLSKTKRARIMKDATIGQNIKRLFKSKQFCFKDDRARRMLAVAMSHVPSLSNMAAATFIPCILSSFLKYSSVEINEMKEKVSASNHYC